MSFQPLLLMWYAWMPRSRAAESAQLYALLPAEWCTNSACTLVPYAVVPLTMDSFAPQAARPTTAGPGRGNPVAAASVRPAVPGSTSSARSPAGTAPEAAVTRTATPSDAPTQSGSVLPRVPPSVPSASSVRQPDQAPVV